jgi:hypothetical protein
MSMVIDRKITIPTISLGVGLVVVGVFMLTVLHPGTDVLLLMALTVVLLAPLVWRTVARRFDPFEPIVAFVIAYGMMFVVRPGSMIAQGRRELDAWYRVIDFGETFTPMISFALLGAIAFVLGYELPLGGWMARALPRPVKEFCTDTVVAGAIGTGILGILLYGTFLHLTGSTILTSFRDPAQLAQFRGMAYLTSGVYLLIPSTLMLLCVGNWRNNRWITAVGLVMLLTFLAFVVPVGNRLSMLPLLSGLVVYHYARRNTRPTMMALIVFSVIALLASTVLLGVRTANLEGNVSVTQAIIQVITEPERIIEPLTNGGDNGMAETFAAALTVIPEQTPFQYGRDTFGDLLLRPIPRGIWDEKPLVPVHRTVETLWPQAFSEGLANPEFSVLLAFYRDFGAIGIFIGMAGLGVGIRTMYEYFVQYKNSIVSILILGVGLSFVVLGVRDNPVDNLWRWLPMMLPVLSVFTLAGRKRTIADNQEAQTPHRTTHRFYR